MCGVHYVWTRFCELKSSFKMILFGWNVLKGTPGFSAGSSLNCHMRFISCLLSCSYTFSGQSSCKGCCHWPWQLAKFLCCSLFNPSNCKVPILLVMMDNNLSFGGEGTLCFNWIYVLTFLSKTAYLLDYSLDVMFSPLSLIHIWRCRRRG